MNVDRNRLKELFIAACDLPPEDQQEFLSTACSDDPAMERALRQLLRNDATTSGVLSEGQFALALVQSGSFALPDEQLEARLPLEDGDGPHAGDDEPDHALPPRIGRYTIKHPLGTGGMGAVYLATQDNPARDIAIKVIRRGRMSRALVQRFELEAAVLGRLQHPGIAQIYEAGLFDDGTANRPFFAMEYISGETLGAFLARRSQLPAFTLRDRMLLFCEICDAVAHAHQKGVIHRDLKPENILVTDCGTPKIVDFGVARATESDVQLSTIQTGAGQIIGTLPYMSPEQVQRATDHIDVRADVYALGVILYEMLTHRLPIDVKGMSIISASRAIVETEPTPLSTHDRRFRGDLDVIVRKALEKDPNRRYASAHDLAADVRRHLNHEPILARRTSHLEHMRKFARRHRGLVAGLFGIAIALLAGSTAVGWQALRIADEAGTRQDVILFLREMLTSVDPAKTAGEPVTVRVMLDDAALQLEQRFDALPLVKAELHDTVGSTYHLLGAFGEAERHLRSAVMLYEQGAGENDPRTLKAMASLGLTLYQLDRLEDAELVLQDAMRHVVATDDPATARRVRENLAIVLHRLGRNDEAAGLYRLNYNEALATLGPDDRDTLLAQNNLGVFLMDESQFEEARLLLESCLERRRALLGDDVPETILSLGNLGALYGNNQELRQLAEPLLREAAERSHRVLGPMHVSTMRRRVNLIKYDLQQQRFQEGAHHASEHLAACEEHLGPSHSETLAALELTVAAIGLGGDMKAAEELALSWHARLEAELGPGHRSTGRVAHLLFNVYDELGSADQANFWKDRASRSQFRN